MKEENNGYLGFACFFFLIVIIVALGSVVLYYTRKSKMYNDDLNGAKIVLTDKNKKDKNKDFIYYANEKNIYDELDVKHRKAVINLNSKDADLINTELDKLYNEALSSVKMSNESDSICENKSLIYSATYNEYAIYQYKEYITLLIMENKYSCNNEVNAPSRVISYTFDVTSGKLITDTNLLNMYNVTYTSILNKIETQLKSQQIVIDDISNINIEKTLNELKYNETYTIYFSESKKLVVKYIVKTNSVDYNDVIELN